MSVVTSAIGSTVGKLGPMKIMGGGFALKFGYDDYRNRVNEGENTGAAMAKAAVGQALWFVPGLGGVMMAKMAADLMPMAGQAANAISKQQVSRQNRAYKGNFGYSNNFNDSQQAATMRQRGVNAINNGNSNIKSVLGSEARTLFRYANHQ